MNTILGDIVGNIIIIIICVSIYFTKKTKLNDKIKILMGLLLIFQLIFIFNNTNKYFEEQKKQTLVENEKKEFNKKLFNNVQNDLIESRILDNDSLLTIENSIQILAPKGFQISIQNNKNENQWFKSIVVFYLSQDSGSYRVVMSISNRVDNNFKKSVKLIKDKLISQNYTFTPNIDLQVKQTDFEVNNFKLKKSDVDYNGNLILFQNQENIVSILISYNDFDKRTSYELTKKIFNSIKILNKN